MARDYMYPDTMNVEGVKLEKSSAMFTNGSGSPDMYYQYDRDGVMNYVGLTILPEVYYAVDVKDEHGYIVSEESYYFPYEKMDDITGGKDYKVATIARKLAEFWAQRLG